MSETHPLILVKKDDILTDRSRIVTDWACPRRRYYQYEYRGRGIVTTNTSLELFLGQAYHDALARLADSQQAVGHLTDAVVDAVADEVAAEVREVLGQTQTGEVPSDEAVAFAGEQAALVEGMVRGLARVVWPRLMQEYPVIRSVEQEMPIRLSDRLILMTKPDLIVARDVEDAGAYVEWKGTSSKKREWIDSWNTAVQLHSTVKAVAANGYPEPEKVIVQGLYKGYESYGKQNSPFCYAYVKGAVPPFVKEQVRYEYQAGFRREATWLRPGGVKAWIEGMPETQVIDQFPQTPPILVKDHLVEAFFRQILDRELTIANTMTYFAREDATDDGIQTRLDDVFPQRFDQCRPAWGHECAYRRLCHGRVDDPLAEGFVAREAHHAAEAERHAAV